MRFLVILSLALFPFLGFSQSSYVYSLNTGIYQFLDELASDKIISINSVIKPYTRSYIYEKLKEAQNKKDQLNDRQLKELEHYFDYYTFGNKPNYLPTESKINLFKKSKHLSTSINHIAFFYSDSLFSCSVRPIVGVDYCMNSSGDYLHTYRGAEAFMSLGEHVGVYADLRDNTVNKILVLPTYFTNEQGGIYKTDVQENGGADYSEMRGGILLSWSFLQIGIVKENMIWGNNYDGGLILSGHTPSFPMIKLHINPVKWFDFNYFHAWLVSDVIDSMATYVSPNGNLRERFREKYMAANMFTIIPVKGLNLSFGNSIIYSDQNVNPAYLIPVFFYKSVDHTLTSYKIENQNSQMFLDFSLRLIKHTHFFLTAYWDDFSYKRITDPERHNFYSYKVGGKISNWPISNISILGEYFRSTPITYKHYVPTLSFESNSFNLGSYLRDNSDEIYLSLEARPLPHLLFKYAYSNARHGNEFTYINGYIDVTYPILGDITWSNTSHSVSASWEFLTNCHFTLEYLYSNIKGFDVDGHDAQYYLDYFTPAFFQGKKHTFCTSINIGF